jgi:fimbrial isopeptide formation D2 family protein/LPXTG-motif cell wall-anchored protein
MNKVLKGLVAVVSAAAMAIAGFAGAASATAAPDTTTDYTLTIKNSANGHTYDAYQVFKGRISESALVDIEWGSGVDSTALTAKGAPYEGRTAAQVAESLSGKQNDSTEAKDFANTVAGKDGSTSYLASQATGTALGTGSDVAISGLKAGYYLIKDSYAASNKGEAFTAYILKVVGNVEASLKVDYPTVEKKVMENNKFKDASDYGAGYNDVADYNIGDQVPFKLIGTVPDMSRYTTYKYVFHDTADKGLTLPTDKEGVKVYVADDKAGSTKAEITDPALTVAVSGQNLTVSFQNLKTVKGVSQGKFIIVEYSATLNSDAVIGLDGNTNTVNLEYSNNPNNSGEGENTPTDKTPDDKVIVFTYKLDTTKVDSKDETRLPGAEFKLKNANNKYAVVDSNNKVTSWSDTQEGGTTLTSDGNGLFSVTGLDDDTYYLKETKAPAGYNLPENDFTVKITATTKNNQQWDDQIPSSALTNIAVSVNGGNENPGETRTGTVAIKIENTKGSSLPSTGGMGTKILYAAGAVIVLVAAFGIVFAVRRRNAR